MFTFSPFGYEGSLVRVEVDLRRGIPAVDIVGLADGAVKESRERMKAAIRNSGFEFPAERVLISLSPADLKKEGAGFDLPLALGVLEVQNELHITEQVLVMGELELSGRVRPVKGVHAACSTALANGIEYAILPKGTDIPIGIKACEVETLEDAFNALKNIGDNKYFKSKAHSVTEEFSTADKPIFDDMPNCWDSIENYGLKYASVVAAAGRHNLIAWGSPGCGKTMALQNFPLLTPRLTFEEAQSVTRIWSLAGLIKPNESYVPIRPFRIPHQTASIEGICGGGVGCRPGEISLAHNGALFLDEAAEFRSSILQMLRVPLENHSITLCRAGRSTVYPANFQLIMAANPCPCGNYGSKEKICLCSAKSIEMYWKKFSAPLLDRVQIRYNCSSGEEFEKLTLDEARELITRAWRRQMKRQGRLNNDLNPTEIVEFCKLSSAAQERLDKYTLRYDYSPRAVSSVIRVARTLCDMNERESEEITVKEIDKAVKLYGELPL